MEGEAPEVAGLQAWGLWSIAARQRNTRDGSNRAWLCPAEGWRERWLPRGGGQPGPGDLRQPRGRGATEPRPFPSPSAQGPGCLMGIPVPPPGSREASDWLGL